MLPRSPMPQKRVLDTKTDIWHLQISKDGKLIGHDVKTAYFIRDFATFEIKCEIKCWAFNNNAYIASDSKHVIYISAWNTMKIMNIETKEIVDTIVAEGECKALSYPRIADCDQKYVSF